MDTVCNIDRGRRRRRESISEFLTVWKLRGKMLDNALKTSNKGLNLEKSLAAPTAAAAAAASGVCAASDIFNVTRKSQTSILFFSFLKKIKK